MAASRARRRFPISLRAPQLRHEVRDFDGSSRRFGSAIDFIFEAPFSSLSLIIEAQDNIEDGGSVAHGDPLQCVSHGARKMFGMIGLAFQDYADGNHGIAASLGREL